MNRTFEQFNDADVQFIKKLREENHTWDEIAKSFSMTLSSLKCRVAHLRRIGKLPWEHEPPKNNTIVRHSVIQGKTYAEIMKEKGINLSKYLKNQTWGGYYKKRRLKPDKSSSPSSC